MSDNNKDMMELIKAIGDTPGFRLADANSGNFRAVRMSLEHEGHTVDEATKVLSIRSKNSSFKDTVADLEKKLGWTKGLHDDLTEIVRAARIAESDPTKDVTERLMTAFLPGWNDEPEPEIEETPEERRERIRHDRTLAHGGGGSAKTVKGGKAQRGATTAPPQVIQGAGLIRPEHVSPERALDLLVTVADYQRKLKPGKVAEFKRMMEAGEWKLLASDPICIDVNGKLCNGQHRLEAVYQLEKGQDFYVAYDVDPGTYDVMDRGTRRTTADMLYGQARRDGTTRSDVSAAPLAALLKMLYLWENIPQEAWASEQRNVHEQQVMDAHKRHPYAEDSVAHGRLSKLKIRPTASMFAHYMITYRHDFDPAAVKIVDAWYEELRTPRLIRPGDPAFALREFFLGGEMDKVARRRSLPTKFHEQLLQTYLILRAWDNTTIGKPMVRLSWKPSFEIISAAPITDKISFPPGS